MRGKIDKNGKQCKSKMFRVKVKEFNVNDKNDLNDSSEKKILEIKNVWNKD